MKAKEYAGEYLQQYENTDVTIISVTNFEGCNSDPFLAQYEECVAFDLSDGTHWLADSNDTYQVANSLTDAEVIWSDDNGWILLEDGEEKPIAWID